MEKITEKQAIALLRKYAPSEEVFKIVLNHSKAVKRIATRIASKCKGVDMYKIRIGSLLHDIGRFRFPPGKNNVKHGIAGAEILRKEGLEDYAKIAERHLGVGIRKQDIIEQKLELPHKDFVPKTREEKIISHADNLIEHDKERSLAWCMDRYRKELGERYAQRIKDLAEEVDGMKE